MKIKINKNILLKFLADNVLQLIVVAFVGFTLLVFAFLPYLNLLFNIQKAIYITFFLSIFLFKITSDNLAKIGLFTLLFSIPFYIFSFPLIQEVSAMILFLSFLGALIKDLFSRRSQ